MGKKILEAQNISKSFGVINALQNVKINLFSGEAMALLGENGAGKSTLIKCLSGVYKLTSGTILIADQKTTLTNIDDATKAGIAVVHQELNLCENLSIAENIFLGRTMTSFGLTNYAKMYKKAKYYLEILGTNLNPRTIVNQLSIAQQQMVEIAKALSLNARILILDEPTDALSKQEAEHLFAVIKKIKANNIAILYVTHRMEEVKKICERFTILKDGVYINSGNTNTSAIDHIIEQMIGRKIAQQFPVIKRFKKTSTIIEIDHLTNKYLTNITLKIKRGEILGIAGLVGSGRTEFAKTIIGLYKKQYGKILFKGQDDLTKNVKKSIKNGIFYVTENRKKDGLNIADRIDFNMVSANLGQVTNKAKLISYQKIKNNALKMKSQLDIKFNKPSDPVVSLSGGNQQKVLLAKALLTNPELLILDEPTRGVDVGARKEIYKIIAQFVARGKGVVVISSDLPEVIGISHRVAVFQNGKISGILKKQDLTEKKIMDLALKKQDGNNEKST